MPIPKAMSSKAVSKSKQENRIGKWKKPGRAAALSKNRRVSTVIPFLKWSRNYPVYSTQEVSDRPDAGARVEAGEVPVRLQNRCIKFSEVL